MGPSQSVRTVDNAAVCYKPRSPCSVLTMSMARLRAMLPCITPHAPMMAALHELTIAVACISLHSLACPYPAWLLHNNDHAKACDWTDQLIMCQGQPEAPHRPGTPPRADGRRQPAADQQPTKRRRIHPPSMASDPPASQPAALPSNSGTSEASHQSQLQGIISAGRDLWGPDHAGSGSAESRLRRLHCCLTGLSGSPPAAKQAADLGPLVGQWLAWSLAPSSMLFVTAEQLALVLGELGDIPRALPVCDSPAAGPGAR